MLPAKTTDWPPNPSVLRHFDIGYCEGKDNLKLIEGSFIVLAEKESVIQSWLKDFEQVFAVWRVVSLVPRDLLEHLHAS